MTTPMPSNNPPNRVLANAALWEASRQGDIGGIRAALAEGADGLGVALAEAALYGQTAVIHYLIDHGAPVDGTSGAPIVVASGAGRLEAVEILLERGADPNKRSYIGGWYDPQSALYQAIESRRLDIARTLLEHGADPTKESDWIFGITAGKEYLEETRLLLEYGAIPSVETLNRAVLNGHINVANLLSSAIWKAGILREPKPE